MATLQQMFVKEFGLYEVQVDYCRFGRDEKKPTLLWTNSFELCRCLRRFRCETPFCDGVHIDVRGNTGKFDFSVIPEPLAVFVSEWVNSKFVLDKIRTARLTHPSQTEAE